MSPPQAQAAFSEFLPLLELFQRRVQAGSPPEEILEPVLIYTLSTINSEAGALVQLDPTTRTLTLQQLVPADAFYRSGKSSRLTAELRDRLMTFSEPICLASANGSDSETCKRLRKVMFEDLTGFEPGLLTCLGVHRDRLYYLALSRTGDAVREEHLRILKAMAILSDLAGRANLHKKRGSSGSIKIGRPGSVPGSGSEDARLDDLRRDYPPFAEVIGTSAELERVFHDVLSVAPTRCTILLQGESGTGKELLARTIHEISGRKGEPFEAVDCAAFPENLIESELFGHVAGAFTGAHREHRGAFERADGGTIFLDELGEMTPGSQSRLLRVLQEGTFKKVGGESEIKVDVRVIAATNRDLSREVGEGRFREDLFYRINHYPIHLSPLRDRREDVPVLIEFFLDRFCRENGLPPKTLSEMALKRLMVYSFPGNIRELQNLVEVLALESRRTSVISDKNLISVFSRYRIDSDSGGKAEHSAPRRKLRPGAETGAWVLERLRDSRFNLSQAEKSLVMMKSTAGSQASPPVVGRHSLTYYLQGECFRHFLESGWSRGAAAQAIAGSPDPQIKGRAEKKLNGILDSVAQILSAAGDPNGGRAMCHSKFSKMPSSYLPYLEDLIDGFYLGKWRPRPGHKT